MEDQRPKNEEMEDTEVVEPLTYNEKELYIESEFPENLSWQFLNPF